MGADLGGLLQLVASREQVLDGVVVQRLGKRLPLPLLRCQCVHHESLASLGELADTAGATFENGREEHCRQTDPGEVAGEHRDEPGRIRTAGRRMEQRLDEKAASVVALAIAVSGGRNRNATAIGTRKKASRAGE